METPLIDSTILREFWGTSKNLSADRVDPLVLRAQQRYLKPFLGDALYYEFATNIATTPYLELFEGEDYEYNGNTIFFAGVKPLLAAFSYGLFVAKNPIHVTRAGNKTKQSEESIEIDADATLIESNQAQSEAIRLQVEVEQYLNTKKDLFPLWQVGDSVGEPVKTGFSFGRVPRSIQR